MIATDNPTIRAKLVGVDTAIAAGITVIAYAPTLELCRKLIAAGYHPAARLEAYRGETLALIIGSIGAAADLTVEDDKQGKPTFRRWRNRPPGGGAAPPISFSEEEVFGTAKTAEPAEIGGVA